MDGSGMAPIRRSGTMPTSARCQRIGAGMSSADVARGDPWDTLHSWSGPRSHWTRSNVGEAVPGVPTPLSWSLWSGCEGTQRRAGYTIGAFTRAERLVPERMEDRYLRIFYGHPSLE